VSARTFGKKIEFFKEYTSDDDQFTPEKLILRDQIYKDLDDLLPQRNSIVHGETYEHQIWWATEAALPPKRDKEKH